MTDQAVRNRVIIVGAGILGLASAYHILKNNPTLNLLVIDRLKGVGRGNTAKSAAAYRDMFSSPLNRTLSQGSIAFYEQVQKKKDIGLKAIGYLWLKTADQMQKSRPILDEMAQAGILFEALEPSELAQRLPELQVSSVAQGILGRNCGIINPNLLCRFYENEILALGGKFIFDLEITGFATGSLKQIRGIEAGEQKTYGTVVVATGAWISLTMSFAGIKVPVVPRKRQLFTITAKEGPLQRLLHTEGFNNYKILPFTIMPGGAYLRPSPKSFIFGYANEDQPASLEEQPVAEPDFFESLIRPQVEPYFPAFQGAAPSYSWAGYYADFLTDNHPLVDVLNGAVVVGGDSGSGIMKADSLGRIAAGMFMGADEVELGDGNHFRVDALRLENRKLIPEELVI